LRGTQAWRSVNKELLPPQGQVFSNFTFPFPLTGRFARFVEPMLFQGKGGDRATLQAAGAPPNHQAIEEGQGVSKQDNRENHPPKHRLRIVALGLLLVLAIIVAVVEYRNRIGKHAPARPSTPIPVVAAAARKGDIGVYYTGLGTVTPIYTVTVRTRVDGQLMKVLYREGESVREGRELAEVDPRPFEVTQIQAEGQLLKDQAALANAKTDLARYEVLIKHHGVAEQVLATERALVVQDEGAVKTDEGQIASAKLNILYCHITSPISGRVGLRLVDPGNIVHATDTNGLSVVAQVRPISVIFTISEDQLLPVLQKFWAGERMPVEALNRDMKTKLADGHLATVDNEIDQTTGTLKLRANFANKDENLFPNQFVNARMLVEVKHSVTLVPTPAIQRNSQTTFVYLVDRDNHTVSIRNVVVGTVEGEQAEIVSGLIPGDIVVTSGVDKLREGTWVTPQIS
jgi:multidrug efflux system membrane fusion protein